MRIEILRECDSSTTEKVHEAFDRLLPQLSSSAQPLSLEEIQKLLAQDCLHLVCAVDEDEQILGMLSLVVFDIPTGRRAWIEDVVTDQAARGQGVGQGLVDAAVEHARELGAKQSISHLGRRERRRTASTVGLVSFSAKPTSTGSLSDPVRPVCGRWDSTRCPTFSV